MMRRSPIKRKRDTPRRVPGRIRQQRVKPKAKAAPDPIEAAHITRIAAMGCLVCAAPGHIHHLMKAPSKIRRRDHRWVVCLCQEHHQGDRGVHGSRCGSEAKFEELHGLGVDCLQRWAYSQWLISSECGIPAVSADILRHPGKSTDPTPSEPGGSPAQQGD